MHDDVEDYAPSPTTGPPHVDEYSQPLELGTPGFDRQASPPSPPVDVDSIQINSPIVPAGTVTAGNGLAGTPRCSGAPRCSSQESQEVTGSS